MTENTTLSIVGRIGSEILIQEPDGLCHTGILNTLHEAAEADRIGQVMGWGQFDGEARQWYRLPDAAWTFCFSA